MEYEAGIVEYGVSEFFETYSSSLPKVVIVTQGFQGEIIEDTFDKGQVVRIHTVSKQKRVVAKTSEGVRMTGRHYSLPLDYPIKLCVVQTKRGKVGKERTLQEIVQSTPLPAEVQFARNQTVTVGSKKISTSNLPSLRLMDTFEEIHLLGNFLNHGVLFHEVVGIPLYLSKLRLAEVTGFKGQPSTKWLQHLEALNAEVTSKVTFNKEFGSKDIAVYHPGSIHPGSIYSYIEPSIYDNLTVFWKIQKPENLYEEIPANPPTDTGTSHSNTETHAGPSADEPSSELSKRPPPPLAPKPKGKASTAEDTSACPPVVPRRNPDPGPALIQTTASPMNNKYRLVDQVKTRGSPEQARQAGSTIGPHYVNDIPRSAIAPTKQLTSDVCAYRTEEDTRSTSGARQSETGTGSESHTPPTIELLTVAQVSEALTSLRLEKYVQPFKDDLVDGTILLKLDAETLKEDFGMRKVEAIRLLQFAKDGHVPK